MKISTQRSIYEDITPAKHFLYVPVSLLWSLKNNKTPGRRVCRLAAPWCNFTISLEASAATSGCPHTLCLKQHLLNAMLYYKIFIKLFKSKKKKLWINLLIMRLMTDGLVGQWLNLFECWWLRWSFLWYCKRRTNFTSLLSNAICSFLSCH